VQVQHRDHRHPGPHEATHALEELAVGVVIVVASAAPCEEMYTPSRGPAARSRACRSSRKASNQASSTGPPG
jgi:hypothetical protein